MDTYLSLAEKVLRDQRRALSASQILRLAYALGIAPAHLRGRTQHKTLQARLSEDILHQREGSRFYRTAPGRFFLREFLDDAAIPEAERTPIIARRRKRDLPRPRALALNQATVDWLVGTNGASTADKLSSALEDGRYHYIRSSRHRTIDDVLVWSYVVVIKDGHVLSYRSGSYREDRDCFHNKRMLGFYSPIAESDLDLFDQADHGIVTCGLKTVATDLNLDTDHLWSVLAENSQLQAFIYSRLFDAAANDLLAVVSFACPSWLEPTSSRLAINDLRWLDLSTPPNHLEDFDPWSRAVLDDISRLARNGGAAHGQEIEGSKSRAS